MSRLKNQALVCESDLVQGRATSVSFEIAVLSTCKRTQTPAGLDFSQGMCSVWKSGFFDSEYRSSCGQAK